jgi:hypothetical protein
MPMIMITCPKTMKPVPTGVNVPVEMLSGFQSNGLGCPACGGMHVWDGSDGYAAGTTPKAPPRK